MPKRILSGKVVKKSGDKTVSVIVTRQTTHPIYKKIIRVSKKYLAHDANNTIAVGENVKIQESVNVWKAYEQAEENSGDYEPIVVIKRNNTKPLILVDADYFVRLHNELVD